MRNASDQVFLVYLTFRVLVFIHRLLYYGGRQRNDVTALKAASSQLWDKFVRDMPGQEQSVFRLISEQP